MGAKSVLFLHLPKTGGLTLRSIIERQYSASAIYTFGHDLNGSIRAFRERPRSEWVHTHALFGHMSYGLHRFMRQPYTYISMLRHPVERALSDYHYVTSTQSHPLHAEVRDMDLREYMLSGITGQLSNGQTRLMCGDCDDDDYGIPTLRVLTERDLDIAKQYVVDHFALVGLQEKFDQSLLLMRRQLRWKLPFYLRRNVTKHARRRAAITAADSQFILEQNRLDIALYAFASARLDRAIRDYGARFATDLAAFRILNRVFQKIAYTAPEAVRVRLGQLARRVIDY